MQDLFDLSGKNALVTGATHGLGMSMGIALAKCGANLVFNDIDQQKINDAIKEYATHGINAHGYLFDVTNQKAVDKNISEIENTFGPIHILINNAGIILRVPALEMDPEDFRKVVDIDLVAPFIMSQRIARKMKEIGGGKIINICSMMSELGRDSVSAYAAAKGGLKMLTKNLATEWAKYNINVNGIGPGYFATSQTAPIRIGGHPFNEFILNRTPSGRWGNPDDLQGTTIFLASRASDFINGQVIYVDGGILATIGKPRNE